VETGAEFSPCPPSYGQRVPASGVSAANASAAAAR
jgi:hypothetical protein